MTDDKKRKTQEDDAPVVDKQQLQARILGGIKPNVGEMTGKWVVDLSEGEVGQVAVPTSFDEQKAEKFPDDMRSWVERIFDDFQRYIYEYNKAIDQQELLINSERPNFIKDSNAANSIPSKYRSQQVGQPQPMIFQGHLYTRHWALLIRGEEGIVKAYALPADFLIAFETRQDEFKPYFEMRGGRNKKGLMIWHVDAVPISFEALGAVSKALFGALVKASRNELNDKERFKLASAQKEDLETTDTEAFVRRYTIPPGASKLTVNDIQKAQAQLQSPFARLGQPLSSAPLAPPQPMLAPQPSPASSQGMPPGVDQFQRQYPQGGMPQSQQASLGPAPAPTPAAMPAPMAAPMPQLPPQPPFSMPAPQQQVQAPQPMYQQAAPMQQPMQQPQPQSQPMAPPQQYQQQPPPQPQPMAAPHHYQQQQPPPQPQPVAPPQQYQPQPQLQALPQSQPLPQSSDGDDVNARLNDNRAAVLSALQQVNQTLQLQMEHLTKIGVASLHQQSMEGVMQVMKRTNSLKAMREKLEAVIQEWNNIQSSK